MRIALFIPLILLAACSNPTSNTQTSDSTSSETEDTSQLVSEKPGFENACYQHLFGKQSQDTSFVQIKIEGNDVTGIYNHLPYQKDSRKGTFSGIINNGTINAVWRFMQEGTNDSLPLKLRLEDSKLYQQNYSYDPKTGRPFLPDTAKFSIPYKKIDCN